MKKIAFIYDVIYPYSIGGVEQRIYNLSINMRDDYEIHIIGMKYWKGDKDKTEDGIHYHGIMRKKDIYKENGDRNITEPIIFSLKLFFFLLKNNFDIIDNQSFPFFNIFSVFFAKRFRKTKIFTTWHEFWNLQYWIEYKGYIIGTIGFIVQYLSLIFSSNIIANSDHTKKRLSKYVKSTKIKGTIPNGINKIDMDYKKDKKLYDLSFVGRLKDFKNVDKIIDILKLNKTMSAIIIGNGDQFQTLKRKSKRLNIKFTGFIQDQKEVYKYISKSKIFMMLSKREGFSIVTLEALSLGVPVICFNGEDNAAKDLIKDGINGIITDLNMKNIKNAIDTINSNYTLYSLNAKKMANEYTYIKITKNLIQIYTNT